MPIIIRPKMKQLIRSWTTVIIWLYKRLFPFFSHLLFQSSTLLLCCYTVFSRFCGRKIMVVLYRIGFLKFWLRMTSIIIISILMLSRVTGKYRVFRKSCDFFHNSMQSLPLLHHCKRPSKLSKQCECTVTPISCTTNSSRVLARWQTFENS